MDPILGTLRIGELERPIGGYGLMLATAMLVGTVLAVRAAARAKMDVGATIAVMGFALAGGLAGSWLLYIAVEWFRTGTPLDALRHGGFVFLGGPVGGAIAVLVTARMLKFD